MNYSKIRTVDVANGTGVRVSLFVSGCTRHCPGCFNPETWDFDYGSPFGESELNQILDALEPDHIEGLTILGGEPFEPQNLGEVLHIIKRVRESYPDKSIWCYTGFTLEALRKYKISDRSLKNIDVIVDGRFIEAKKNLGLRFRGSENQRIIDIQKTLHTGKIVERTDLY